MMYRMLIADDEPIERTVIRKKINRYFPDTFDISTAENGREAVQVFLDNACDVAVLDIEMPGMNGLSAAEEIRKRNRECSIVFLTAFDEFNYAKKAISVKALDYLLKPCEDKELISVLEEAIRLTEENRNKKRDDSEAKKKEHGIQEKDINEVRQKKIAKKEIATKGRRIDSWEETEMADSGPGPYKEIRLEAVEKVILSYIENHYKEDISLQDAAKAMNYSDPYFCKLFKLCFEKSFTTYLAEFRVEQAKRCLADVRMNVKKISDEVGYRDSNYFAKVFKRVVGITPSEYRICVLENKENISGKITRMVVPAGDRDL